MMKFLLLFFILFVVLTQAQEQERVSLQLKWKYQFQFAGFLVAKERGFYKDVGLDVEIREFDTDTNIVEEVVDSKATFGLMDPSLVLDAMKGEPVVAIMPIFQHSPYVLMGLKSSGIDSLDDMNSKNIGLHKNLNAVTVLAMLESNKIEYKFEDVSFNFDRLNSKELDLQIAYILNEPFIAKERGIEVVTFAPKDYGFDSYGDILFTSQETLRLNPKTVENFRLASKKGWEYAYSHIDEVVDLIYNKYNTLNKSKKALRYEAGELKNLSGIDENFGELNRKKMDSTVNVYSFMIKGNYDRSRLDDFVYKNEDKNSLTKKEKEYLKENTFTICTESDYYPLEFIKENQHVGISADILSLMQKQNIFKTKLIPLHFSDTIVKVSNRGCDIKSTVMHKYNIISKYMDETLPIVDDNLVLISNVDMPFITNIKSLKGKKLVVRVLAFKSFLNEHYPSLNITLDYDIKNIVSKIESKEYFALISPSLFANLVVQKYGYNNLKVVMKLFEYPIHGVMGVSKEKPKLLKIMNKLIKNISQKELDNTITRWNIQTYHKFVDYRLIKQIIAVALLILVILLIAYLRQKQLSQKIQEEKDKFQNIFDKSADGVSILANGIFTECNDSLVKLLGYETKDQVINLTPSQLSPEYQPDGQKSLDKSLLMIKTAREYGYNHFEWRHLKADGEEFWVEIVLTNVSIKDDENIIHVVWRDIQHRKELEKELLDFNMNLEVRVDDEVDKNKKQQLMMLQHARLAQMGEMLSMIAHQWRQPLNSLSLITQGLALKYKISKLNDEVMQKFELSSEKQITQMSRTIEDFMNFFRPEKEKKVFNVNEPILHAVSILSPIFEKEKILIETSLENDFLVDGYENELGQAILNIITNAKDALADRNRVEKKFIKIYSKITDDKISLFIEDNAGGIESNFIKNVFDPYFSTKEEKNGTGLGLYMTKLIIDEHMRGSITVSNTKKGAMFTIVLNRSLREK